jgi:hypothetical protein
VISSSVMTILLRSFCPTARYLQVPTEASITGTCFVDSTPGRAFRYTVT